MSFGASSCAGTDLEDHHDKAAHDSHAGADPHHKNSPRPYYAEAPRKAANGR